MAIEERSVSDIDQLSILTNFFRPVTNADYPALEKVSESAIKEKQKFERLVVSKEKLLEMFNVRQLEFFKNESICLQFGHSTTNSKST
jgi:threonyl-tRNA synthetase